MTPNAQLMRVSRNTMSIEQRPRSNTAKGGKMVMGRDWRQDMANVIILRKVHQLALT